MVYTVSTGYTPGVEVDFTLFRKLRRFFQRRDGQDLAEYCLLMAFVGLVALGIILKASGGIQGIWAATNTTLAAAPASSSSAAGTPATASGSADQNH